MSKADRTRKRQVRKGRYAKPSAPRMIGANDNHANDNAAPVTIRGVKLTENQRYRMTVAEERIASDDLSNQRLGHLMLEALEKEVQARREGDDVEAALAERRGLEALRGYDIGQSSIEGAVGAPHLSRDGLETLLTAGSITRTLHAAGLRFRTDYERIDPERKLTPPTLLREGKTKGNGGEGFDVKIAESWARVRTIYLIIAGVEMETARAAGDEFSRPTMPQLPADHPFMRAIHALNEVAGKGRNIRDLASGGRTRTRIRDDLEFALDACAIIYGLE